MKSEPYSLRELLLFQRRYIVPIFQRDYEWTKDDQWELLIEDLVAAADRLDDSTDKASPHFMGAIVLDKMPSMKAAGLQLRSVIDGQQRLITLQLLIKSMLDVAREVASKKEPQLLRLLRNPSDLVSCEADTHKLWPRRRDQQVWLHVMAHGPVVEQSTHSYFQARNYFYHEIRRFVEDDDSHKESKRFDRVVDALLSGFKVVVIELDDDDDAQVIFEVLNGRQTPLSASDLVKNLIFLKAERENLYNIDLLYADYWEQFDNEWWKQKVGRGHAARPHTDRMLAAWLTAVSDKPLYDPQRLYGQMRRYLDGSPLEMELVLSEISEYATHYQVFYAQKPETDSVARAFSRIRQLGYITAMPLLLWLRQQSRYGNLAIPEYTQAVLDIESYILRRVITRQTTRGYGKTFWNILKAASGTGNSDRAARIVREELCKLEGHSRWPSDALLEEAFVEFRFYGSVARYAIKIILGSIEEQIKYEDQHTEKSSIKYSQLTIEHIMPQSWKEDDWPLVVEESERAIAEQNRQTYLHRMGNLTLLSAPLNVLQSNNPWEAKRNALKEHSSLRMNLNLAQSDKWATWNEKAITNRAQDLASYAARVWPRPPSS